MNLPYNVFPSWLNWAATVLFFVLFAAAIRTAPWRRYRDKDLLNVLLGSCVLLLLIWSLKAGVKPGLTFHLLGGTLFMLMFGWAVAFIAMSLVLAGGVLNGAVAWQGFALNALVMGAIPILATQVVYRLAVKHLPHHFFVYIIVNAYFCAGLAMALTVSTSSFLLVMLGPYRLDTVLHDYLPFVPFMVFGEGFMTGMLVTGMALMKPQWLTTFDDRRYIAGK
jgi:uncharacterized membrane protein